MTDGGERPPGPDVPLTLALDLEGTLVTTAAHGAPRPGLRAFLDRVTALGLRLVLFTGVDPPAARAVLDTLARDGHLSAAAARLPIVAWDGRYKQLAWVTADTPDPAAVVGGARLHTVRLVDDTRAVVHPDEEAAWIAIAPYDPPGDATDRDLERVAGVVEAWVQAHRRALATARVPEVAPARRRPRARGGPGPAY